MESDQDLDHERTELQEDEKKLQIALQEYDEEWDYASDDEDDEEGRFLIDLENEGSAAGTSLQSAHSGTSSIGSVSHSAQQNNLVDDPESVEARERRALVSNLPSSSFDSHDLENSTIGIADPEKTLALNRALQGILEGHIEAIQEALDHNKDRQENLEKDVADPKKPPKGRAGPFRAPYFRVDSEYPEPNEDMLAKRQMGQARLANPLGMGRDLRLFKPRAKNTLKKCVIEDCLEQMIRPLMSKMEAEIERCDQAKSSVEEQECRLELEQPKLEATKNSKARMDLKFLIAELEEGIREQKAKVKEHTKNISKLEEDIKNVKNNTNEEELLDSVDSEKVDWMRISKMSYGGNKSYIDCQKAWDHFVNPKVQTGYWTTEEKARLEELVKAAGAETSSQLDWVQIARDLGTGRTAFQCMGCYQRCFNTELRSRPWTADEDKRLVVEANKVLGCSGFFNWRKVSALVDNRSPYECMHRFTQVDPNHHHGKFTPEEDAKLLAGVEMFGLRWRAIARFIGSRSGVQVRDRYMDCLNPENNYLSFTYDEDLKLLKYHKKLGPVWAQIAQYFQGRSSSRLGSRFRQLQRWKKKKEWFDSQPAEVKRILLGKSLPVRERRAMEAKVKEYFIEQMGINLEDYKRQALDCNNKVDPDIIPPRPPFVIRFPTSQSKIEQQCVARWAQKLHCHENLRQSLQRILNLEAQRKARAKLPRKLPKVVEEERAEELANRAVAETLKDQEQVEAAKPKKGRLKRMEVLLAKAFHEGSSVHVSKILQTLNNPKEGEKLTEKTRKKHQSLDQALRNFFKPDDTGKYRPGRTRKFFDKDMRDHDIILAEKKELERCLPAMCLKSFGSSIPHLYLSARQHHVLLQEQLLNFPSYEEDSQFLAQEAQINQDMEECAWAEEATGEKQEVAVEKHQRKKRRLNRLFKRKYVMEHKKLKTSSLSLQEDIAHFHKMMVESGEPEMLTSDLLPVWSIKTKTQKQNSEKGEKREWQSSSAPQVVTPNSSECDRSLKLPAAQASDEETVQKNQLSSGCSPSAANSKELRRLKLQDIITGTSDDETQEDEVESSQLHLLSQAELQEERHRLQRLTLSNTPWAPQGDGLPLPCLPPNLTTLSLLKSLLLKRGVLMRLAAPLTEQGQAEAETPVRIDIQGEATVSNSKAAENIVLVDSEGKEIQMEDFVEFIEEETQDKDGRSNKVGDRQRYLKQGEKMDQALKFIRQNSMKYHKIVRHAQSNDAQVMKIVSSNPEYDVANFSLKESSGLQESTKESSGVSIDVKKLQAQVASKEQVEKPQPSDFLPPKSFVRAGKTYASVHKKKTNGSAIGIGNTTDSCDGDGKNRPSQLNSTRTQPCSGSSSVGFDFPNLTNAGTKVIEVVQDSESESGENDDDCSSQADEEVSLAAASKYQCLFSSVRHERRLAESNIVVVDIAANSGNIVHYRKDSDSEGTFKPFESKETCKAETPMVNSSRCVSEVVDPQQGRREDDQETMGSLERFLKVNEVERKLKALPAIKESHEYKMLKARLRALFLWPALMSTVKHIKNPRLMESVQSSVGASEGPRPQIKKRGRGRPPVSRARRDYMTKAQRREEHLKSERYRRSQFMQLKRQERKEAMAAASTAGQPENSNTSGADGHDTRPPPSEPVHLEDVTLAFPAEKRRRGRQRGGTYKRKVYPPAIERPKRSGAKREPTEDATVRPRKARKVKEKSPPSKTPMDLREPARVVPQWWKDALLAAMMAKQTLEREGESEGLEVPIEEDDDFLDKGGYSDDEWVQDWRKNESERPGEDGVLGTESEISENVGEQGVDGL